MSCAGEHEEPAWRDSLHLKSNSGQSADVKLAIKLAAKQMNRQPKATAPKPLRMSIDRGMLGGTRRGSMHKCAVKPLSSMPCPLSTPSVVLWSAAFHL